MNTDGTCLESALWCPPFPPQNTVQRSSPWLSRNGVCSDAGRTRPDASDLLANRNHQLAGKACLLIRCEEAATCPSMLYLGRDLLTWSLAFSEQLQSLRVRPASMTAAVRG
jgi:hypothetical protein